MNKKSMLLKGYFLCIALLAVTGSATNYKRPRGNLKLELVQVVFRHGERTPQQDEIKLMANVTSNLAEPWGFSQLTNNGKRQEYAIGKLLRRLYGNFLGDMYRPGKVYAMSTDVDRTKASLELVLAALYPPTDELLWNKDLKWMPIPMHFLPKALDNVLRLSSACPKHDKMRLKLLETEKMKKYLATHFGDLHKYLKPFFPETDLDLEQFFYLHNIVTIQKSLNQPAPEWSTPAVREQIRLASLFYLDTLSYTPEMIRLNGGSLLRRMIENMDIRNKKGNNPRRIYLYSGHEFTVYAFVKAHNIHLKISPSYGSAVILEKLRDEQGGLFVKMNYWTGLSKELVTFKLNGCSKICPIEKYLQIVAPHISTDEDLRCLVDNLTTEELLEMLKSDVSGISS